MKGRINFLGHLQIERAGKLKDAFCPFADRETHCGHWCPLFGEPSNEVVIDIEDGAVDRVALPICKKVLLFEELTDERGSHE